MLLENCVSAAWGLPKGQRRSGTSARHSSALFAHFRTRSKHKDTQFSGALFNMFDCRFRLESLVSSELRLLHPMARGKERRRLLTKWDKAQRHVGGASLSCHFWRIAGKRHVPPEWTLRSGVTSAALRPRSPYLRASARTAPHSLFWYLLQVSKAIRPGGMQ